MKHGQASKFIQGLDKVDDEVKILLDGRTLIYGGDVESVMNVRY